MSPSSPPSSPDQGPLASSGPGAAPSSQRRRIARLVERARAELPEPGDPRRLVDDLLAADLAGPEALEVLGRSTLAWTQLRDLRLERTWQGGYGWFLARNVMLYGLLLLLYAFVARPQFEVVLVAVTSVGVYYVIVVTLGPLRLRRHRRRRAGILAAYGADLGGYLDVLEQRAAGTR